MINTFNFNKKKQIKRTYASIIPAPRLSDDEIVPIEIKHARRKKPHDRVPSKLELNTKTKLKSVTVVYN